MKDKKAKKVESKILAFGEATGHVHQVEEDDATVWDEGGGVMLLDAPNGATVSHQEHKTLRLPPGKYNRLIVKEYDHLAEEARMVRD